MKNIIILSVMLTLTFSTNLVGQSQKIDSDIATVFKEVTCSCDLIDCFNSYLRIVYSKDIKKNEISEFADLSRRINKKNIPIYKIHTYSKGMDFYFKKGGNVYCYTLEKKGELYLSTVKYYAFKNKKVKKQGKMAFES